GAAGARHADVVVPVPGRDPRADARPPRRRAGPPGLRALGQAGGCAVPAGGPRGAAGAADRTAGPRGPHARGGGLRRADRALVRGRAAGERGGARADEHVAVVAEGDVGGEDGPAVLDAARPLPVHAAELLAARDPSVCARRQEEADEADPPAVPGAVRL